MLHTICMASSRKTCAHSPFSGRVKSIVLPNHQCQRIAVSGCLPAAETASCASLVLLLFRSDRMGLQARLGSPGRHRCHIGEGGKL